VYVLLCVAVCILKYSVCGRKVMTGGFSSHQYVPSTETYIVNHRSRLGIVAMSVLLVPLISSNQSVQIRIQFVLGFIWHLIITCIACITHKAMGGWQPQYELTTCNTPCNLTAGLPATPCINSKSACCQIMKNCLCWVSMLQNAIVPSLIVMHHCGRCHKTAVQPAVDLIAFIIRNMPKHPVMITMQK
jgi:hypothetical protein